MRLPSSSRPAAPMLTVVTSDEMLDSRENIITPRFSNRSGFEGDDSAEHDVTGECSEVDAFANPTELFQWLNYGNYDGAMQHIQKHPEDAKVWIVSRGSGGITTPSSSSSKSPKGQAIKWRYLPLHLVCLKPDAPDDLLQAIVQAFPKAARKKDHTGNLPVHYLVAEGRHDLRCLRILLEAFPESVHRRDRKGRSLTEIVSEQFNMGQMDKDTMLALLSTIRQWKMGTSFDSGEERRATPSKRASTTPRQQQHEVLEGAAAAAAVAAISEDRDRFIETAAVVTLTNQLTTTARELNTEKEKARRKSEKIHELRANIKGNGERIKGLIQKLETYEEERETIANVSLENRALKMKLEAMERELEESDKRFQSKAKLQARAQAVEAKMKSRISMLEKELLELRTERMQEEITKRICGDPKRVEEERDVLREMNESLQEHLNALKERCKDLEQDEEEKSELRMKLESSMSECAELNRRLSSQLEEAEAAKSESFIAQSRLQTKIATLEKDLLEATAMLEAQAQAMEKPLTDLKMLEEDRCSLQHVNQTLQEHVAALNEKCKMLEKSLQEAKEQVATEKGKDQAALSERQRELQNEFRSISAFLQNLMEVDPSKRGDAEYLRQVEQLRDIVGGGSGGSGGNKSSVNNSGDTQRLVENLKRDRARLMEENEDLRSEVQRLLESREENDHAMSSELQRIAQKAEDYRQQLLDLKGKFEKLKSNNVGLRDVIAKNNSKYISKVEALGKDFKSLQKANASLQEQLHDLTLENRRLREGSQGHRPGQADMKSAETAPSRHLHRHDNRNEDMELIHSGASREQLLKILASRSKGQPYMQHQHQQQAEMRANLSQKVGSYREQSPLRLSRVEPSATQEDRDDIIDEVSALLATTSQPPDSRDVQNGGGIHFSASGYHSAMADHPNFRN